MMGFADFICFDAIVPELEANDRNGVIAELVCALSKAGKLSKKSCTAITKSVITRENEASTGMGKGVAVPHVKHSSVKKVFAAIGQSSAGIDFSALDKQLVHSVILLVSPNGDADMHLKAMETIFGHLQKEKFLSFLRQARTVEEIEDLLKEADTNPSL